MPCIINVLGYNLCFKSRATFALTWYAPLGQFFEDYEGKKYTICDYCRVIYGFFKKKPKTYDNVSKDDEIVKDETEFNKINEN
jgi:hypothetical protein